MNNKVLEDQDVTSLSYQELQELLRYIDKNVIPYINDKNTAGQDLLNLFFTTFNKYVGKSDKNQAFTPDHICDFMSKVVGVNKHSRILDPCCGSGAFLVRAMTDAMDDCETEQERDDVKRDQIFGIEYEEGAYGLSSTNMLIHGDGNSNVIRASMFEKAQWIENANINVVLMNPPYNASRKQCNPEYTAKWSSKKKEDPSKGFHYVEWIAKHVSSNCKMAVLLPMQAAIGNSKEVKKFKKKCWILILLMLYFHFQMIFFILERQLLLAVWFLIYRKVIRDQIEIHFLATLKKIISGREKVLAV